MGTLTGKTIIVTGAAGAIGFATAQVLAREGAKLLLVDLRGDVLAAREAELRKSGAEVASQTADVSKSAEVKAFIDAAVKRFGRLDGLFNNAGIEGKIAPTWEYDEEEFDHVTRVNTNGVFLGMRHALPLMIAQGAGAIVNTASIGSERGLAGACTYNASKHAVVGLTRTAAAEAGPQGHPRQLRDAGRDRYTTARLRAGPAIQRRHSAGQEGAREDRAAGAHWPTHGNRRGGGLPAVGCRELRHRRGLVHRRRRALHHQALSALTTTTRRGEE